MPFNFFGGPFSVTQDMIDYVGIDLVDSINNELDQYGLDFAGSFWGHLVESLAGQLVMSTVRKG